MFGKGLVVFALCVAACASVSAADLPLQSPPPAYGGDGPPAHSGYGPPAFGASPPPELHRFHPGAVWRHGGVAWGLVPGVGQLGAAGFGYYGARHCWIYQPVYDPYGNYFGEQPVDLCVN